VLLVDEVLSVGDIRFQEKCLERMFSFHDQGTTIVIVSHVMSLVEAFCERALWLDKGDIKAFGEVSHVVERYVGTLFQKSGDIATTGDGKEGAQAKKSANDISATPVVHADYASLPELGKIYATEGIFDPGQGTLSVWLKIKEINPRQLTMIFHTDDNRYQIYIDQFIDGEENCEVHRVVGRAGGNRLSRAKQTGTVGFPEVPIVFKERGDDRSRGTGWQIPPGEDNSSAYSAGEVPLDKNRWYLVTMTWQGFPEGKVSLYLDDQLIGEHAYDRSSSHNNPLPTKIAVGMPPSVWRAGRSPEDVPRQGDGLSLSSSHTDIRDLRLYRRTLSPPEIQVRARETTNDG
jgi:hypothetical protein